MTNIRSRALLGDSFAELAKTYSEDDDTKLVGGYLGTFELEQLSKDIYPTLSPLKEGEISMPERLPAGSTYGYHIVWAKRRTPSHTMTLETDYQKLEAMTLNLKRMREYQTWVEELKSRHLLGETAGGGPVNTPANAPADIESTRQLRTAYEALRREIATVIVGQDEIVQHLLIGLLARGHCLLVGVPGLPRRSPAERDHPSLA